MAVFLSNYVPIGSHMELHGLQTDKPELNAQRSTGACQGHLIYFHWRGSFPDIAHRYRCRQIQTKDSTGSELSTRLGEGFPEASLILKAEGHSGP